MKTVHAFEVSGLSVQLHSQRHSRPVLHDLNLAVRAGCWTCVVGPNGAGKSTLLRALAGLLPCQGSVQLLGKPLADYSHRARARTIAWLAQGGVNSVADDLTVYDVVMLGRLPHLPWLRLPSPADEAAVEQALRQTHAWELRRRVLSSLSGGERQRVFLARVLAVQAQIVLMDEPLINLDPPHQADWIALVRKLVAEGRTVVSVLHEISLALLADELLVMQAGKVCHIGPSHESAAHEALQCVFDRRLSIHQINQRWFVFPT